MATQRNFPDPFVDVPHFRARRVSRQDRQLIQEQTPAGLPAEKEVVFGQTDRDVLELYVFDELNDIVGHINLRPDDPALRLVAFRPDQVVGVGQDKTPDVLQVNLVDVLRRLGPMNPETGEPEGLPPGRYSIAINVFRDEIGQEAGGTARKLFISEISPSRRELRLQPVFATLEMINEIREFIEPSVPRFVAQAIVDQTFGASLDPILDEAGISAESVTFSRVEDEIARVEQTQGIASPRTTADRLRRAGLQQSFASAYQAAIPRIRNRVLDALAQNVKDLSIQNPELQSFIRQGVARAFIEMVNAGEIDPRIQLLNRDGSPITQTTTDQE